MNESTGEDLLKLFETLNVNIGGLHKNVIKAWFDTDCPDMKNLLNWMCTSLTKDNFVSPQELAEYSQIENVLKGEELEKEVNNLELERPGLFDLESNLLDIKIIEDELEYLGKEQKHLEQCLMINENLSANLSVEHSRLVDEETKSSLALTKAEDDCKKSAKELDELNVKLKEQLNKCGDEMNNFEQAPIPQFIDNILKQSEDNINNIDKYVNKLIKEKNEKAMLSDEEELQTSSSNDELSIIYNRIANSSKECLNYKLKYQKLLAVDDYLSKFDLSSILTSQPNLNQMLLTIDSKRKEEQVLLDELKESTAKMTDYYLSQPKIIVAENQLKQLESKLQYLNNVADEFEKVIAHFILIRQLNSEETENIKRIEEFSKNLVNYVNKNLQTCQIRTDIMSEIIDEYSLYESKPIEEKSQAISNCIKLISNKDNCTLHEALSELSDRNSEKVALEKQLFISSVEDHWNYTKKLEKNIETLKNFLVSGPTNRTIIIPPELQQLLIETGSRLEEQKLSLKNAMQFSMQALKQGSSDKWKREYRHLWMNFINNPQKMLSVIEEIENEFNSKQKVCFQSSK